MATTSNTGRELLVALKASAGRVGPHLCIPVGTPPQALLRPVPTREGCINPEDVARLTEWRNLHVTAFLTEFNATEGRTAAWLKDVVGQNENKILFMVDDPGGGTFGYVGLDFIDWEASRGEADAIVRGPDAPRGLMKPALVTLLNWGKTQLGLKRFEVRVRSDNTALEFYRKAGFTESHRVPLYKVEEVGMTRWVEDPGYTGSRLSLVHMVYSRNSGGDAGNDRMDEGGC